MKEKPKIIIENCEASGNGSDGIRVEGDGDILMRANKASGNAGRGISVSKEEKKKGNNSPKQTPKDWHEKMGGKYVVGVLIGITVLGIGLVIKHFFGA